MADRKLCKQPRYLITGGAGFIGSAFVWLMNQRGIDDAVIVDNLGTGKSKWRNLIPLRFSEIWSREELLARMDNGNIPESIEFVLHLGACSSTTEENGDYLLDNNYRYSQRLAEWAVARGARFVYASSAAVYGNGELGFDDADNLTGQYRPLNMYGYSKQLFDLFCLRQGWLDKVAGLRYFNVFGPNEYHKESMKSMVFKASYQRRDEGVISLFKSTVPQFKDGDQLRDFVYVKDVVRMTWDVLHTSHINGIFNVGSGTPHSWNDLAHAVSAVAACSSKIQYIDMPSSMVTNYQSFTQAPMQRLASVGISTATLPFEDAVKDYVTGYLGQGLPVHLDPAKA